MQAKTGEQMGIACNALALYPWFHSLSRVSRCGPKKRVRSVLFFRSVWLRKDRLHSFFYFVSDTVTCLDIVHLSAVGEFSWS